MKKIILLLLLVEIHAVEMTDYRTIYGQYDEAYINGSFQARTGNQEQTAYELLLNANSRTIFTSSPYSFEFISQGSASFAQGEERNSTNIKAYDLFTSTRYDKYISDSNMFIYSGTDLGYRKQKSSLVADKALVKVSLGTGYGRVYNATPLAITLRIVEELKRYNIITGDLSDVHLLKLAKVIGIKENYISKHGQTDYKKHWFFDIATVLIRANVLKGNSLGIFGVMKIEEIIEVEKVSGRFHGWKVRSGVGQILSNYDGDSKSTTVDMEYSYGLPLGYEGQFIENALISTNLDSSIPIDFQVNNSMSYTYEISNLIDWENSWVLNFVKYAKGDDIMKNKILTGFRYYVANNLTIDTSLNLEKVTGNNGNSIETPEWDGNFFMGIRYRLR